MSGSVCRESKRSTVAVFNHSAGDAVCSESLLVPELHSVDETFANESADCDPARVGSSTSHLLSKTKTRKKRKPTHTSEINENDRTKKRHLQPCQLWDNLDLVLSLQSKDTPLASKIESAFAYARSRSSDASNGEQRCESLRTTRAAAFLGDWMQHSLISSTRDPAASTCSDFRSWFVLKFSLQTSSFRISPNLLRPVASVLHGAASQLESREFDGFLSLYGSVSECVSVLFASHGRAIYNAGVELWVSCAVAAIGIFRGILLNKGCELVDRDALLPLTVLVLEQFSAFSRSHPTPRNVFRPIVDRLLEPLLELGAALRERVYDDQCVCEGKMLAVVDGVLSDGLFHPSHMSGFLSLKGLNVRLEDDGKSIRGSYHRHLFYKLKKIVLEMKGSAMDGFGLLFHCFANKTKMIKVGSASPGGLLVHENLEKESNMPVMGQEVNQSVFEVFMHMMEPLVLYCRKFVDRDLSVVGNGDCLNLLGVLFAVKSINTILESLMHGKIYADMKNNDEGENFCFLREVYEIIISISRKLHQLFSLETDLMQSGCADVKILNLAAMETVVSIGHLLEIEYRVVGGKLIDVWLTMLLSVHHSLSSADSELTALMKSKALHVACQLIILYSELRQVASPIFALCKAVRFFLSGDNGKADFVLFICDRFLYSKCSEAVATFLLSQPLKVVTSNAIRSIPEGQASAFVEQLNEDVGCSLKWITEKASRTKQKDLFEIDLPSDGNQALKVQFELLGMLSELYATMLDTLPVKISNSNSVRHVTEEVLCTIRPGLIGLVASFGENVDKFLYLVAGIKPARKALPKLQASSVYVKACSSWLLMLLFRLYMSCRSLYQQVIIVLSKKPEKAAGSMGNLFLVAHGESWIKADFMGNYFTWITAPSLSLLPVVEFVSTIVLQKNISACAPLIYILLAMTLQRLAELNRQIKAFEHLHERLSRHARVGFVADVLSLDLGDDELKRKVEVLKKEAIDLTSFLMVYLPSVASIEESISICNNASTEDTASSLSLTVCSLNDKTLPLAVWQLLCKDMHVWCPHAKSRALKKFISPLIHLAPSMKHSLHIGTEREMEECSQTISMHGILSGFLVLDEMGLSKHFVSRILRSLKKSLLPIITQACVRSIDLNLLPEWHEALSVLEELSVVYVVSGHASAVSTSTMGPHKPQPDSCQYEDHSNIVPSVIELRTCRDLINLLCLAVKAHVNARSLKHSAVCILNLERLLLMTLLRHNDESFVFYRFELLKLFVSCRRALRYLGVRLLDGDEADRKSPFKIILCENLLAISWLSKSASEIVALPYGVFGMQHCHETRVLFFSLIDHTSYFFLSLTRGLLFSCLPITTIHEDGIHNKSDEHTVKDLFSASSSPHCHAWQQLELVAEFLKRGTEDFYKIFKEKMLVVSLDTDDALATCNKLSCMVSCVQGFLYGISSVLGNKGGDVLKGSIYSYIDVFNRFVNSCLTVLLVDGQNSEFSCNFDGHTRHEHNLLNFGSADVATSLGSDGNVHTFGNQANPNTCINDELEDSSNQCFEDNTMHKTKATDLLDATSLLDLLSLQNLKRSLLLRLLNGEFLEWGFLIRQLFLYSAATLHLYYTPFSMISQLKNGHMPSDLMNILAGTSHFVLTEMARMSTVSNSSYIWLDGPIKYLEVLGRYFPSSDSVLSRTLYGSLVDANLRALGKCISLLGKTAFLASHETGSCSKTLLSHCQSDGSEIPQQNHDGRCLDALRARLGSCFVKFAKTPVDLHFLSVVQTLERALAGAHQGFHMIYQVDTGNHNDGNGGRVSPYVAGGIYCFDLILQSVSGVRSFTRLKRHMKTLVSSLFNVVAHLRSPTIFNGTNLHNTSEAYPDSGAVILMCIEVVTKIAGKTSYQMDPWHVGQSLNLPMSLFHISLLDRSHVQDHVYKVCLEPVDRHFLVELYIACCRLLCAIIRHRKSECATCICLLQGSVEVLLYCLETTGIGVEEKRIVWRKQEAVKCASFLRRIYEEIRQQKDLLASYAPHFLSSYISISSGFGHLQFGFEREVEEALRPGIYALVDICSPDDLQLIHTVLGETSCRRTLATLQREYKLNFQYEGKI